MMSGAAGHPELVEEHRAIMRRSTVPGRPRSRTADRAILDATLRVLGEQGYAAMSVEGVAAAAGVGKMTIYRRFRDKKELVSAAMSTLVADTGPPPDTGDTRADLVALLRQLQTLLVTSPIFPMAGTLLVEERRHPDLFDRFREAAILPGRARLRTVIERGTRRGDVRPDVDVDAAIDALLGAFFARHLAGLTLSPDALELAVDVIWRGVALPRT